MPCQNFLLLILHFVVVWRVAAQVASPDTVSTLQAILDAFPILDEKGWSDPIAAASACTLDGVVCSDVGELERLVLDSSSLAGEFPSAVANTNLKFLDLGNNSLTSIPTEIASNSRLIYVDLSHNQLTSIPSQLAAAPLNWLYLDCNRLTSLPQQLASPSFFVLSAASNNLSGEFPDELIALSAPCNNFSDCSSYPAERCLSNCSHADTCNPLPTIPVPSPSPTPVEPPFVGGQVYQSLEVSAGSSVRLGFSESLEPIEVETCALVEGKMELVMSEEAFERLASQTEPSITLIEQPEGCPQPEALDVELVQSEASCWDAAIEETDGFTVALSLILSPDADCSLNSVARLFPSLAWLSLALFFSVID